MNWRKQLQDDLDANNTLRAQSLRRVGDAISETKPCMEGCGRARRANSDNHKDTKR